MSIFSYVYNQNVTITYLFVKLMTICRKLNCNLTQKLKKTKKLKNFFEILNKKLNKIMNIILYFVEQDRFLFLFLLIKNNSNKFQQYV